MLASIVLSTRPMLSVSWSRKAWWVTLKRLNDASSTTARTEPSNRIGSTMMFSGVRLAEAGVDRHVVAGDVGEQDALLLLGALADQAFAEAELGGEMLALLVAVAGLVAQHRFAAVVGRDQRVEDAVLGRDAAAPARTGSCSRRSRRSRCPWSMRVKRSRLVFSQSCSVFCRVVSRRLRIISLSLSFRTATSPLASTPTCRVRSPSVTAVATSAIARTWLVRLAASWLTLSVRSFQTPADLRGLGLAAELALDPHLAGDPSHLDGERG